MEKWIGRVVALAVIACVGALGVACEIRVWNECLVSNSWLYCARLLSK